MLGEIVAAPEGTLGYGSSMDIRVLGPVEVRVDGAQVGLGGHKQRTLFALLVAGSPAVVSTDSLLEGIWGQEASPSARSTLQTYVSNLRHVVGEVILYEGGGYRLTVDAEAIDMVRFVAELEAARQRVATDPSGVAAGLRQALGLWRGRPYADLIDVPHLEPEVRRLEELRLEAVELRVDAELAAGRHGALIAELEALAEEHPFRERFRAQHMLALYRSGRQGEALRAYRRTESFLTDELGVAPSEELQDLELKILQQDESLLGGSGRAVTQRLAFLVTDIEESTRLWDRFPQTMAGALATHDRVVREAIETHGGNLFKHSGDGLLAVFGDGVSASSAAEAAQRGLAAVDWGEIGQLRVRMGIDVGDAESRGDDFFGPPLNRAARLCAVGHGGQVLVSTTVQAEVTASAPAGVQVRQLGEVHLRGMATPERVAQLVFVGLPADFPDLRSDSGGVLDDRAEILSLPGYEARERVGEGAFGVVYRAYQPSVGREVAIKMIRPELSCLPSFVRRFEAEARTIARLAHPHIVPLFDFWRDTECAYLVMGLLKGGPLSGPVVGDLTDRQTVRRILYQVGSALDHAHSQGMVHGDLKPANVLLDGAGNAYLSDFGIATRLLDPETVSSLSSDNGFRAPEELTSGPSPEADRFAFGMLARHLLDGDSDLEGVLSRAIAFNPEDRFSTTAAFLAELDVVLGEEPVEERPTVSRNPYKGLRPFDESDSADFHGRGDLVTTLVAAVSEHRFVAVVGPSGSGKSSVVQAGLLPALSAGVRKEFEDWFWVVLTPGPDPMAALAQALERVLPVEVDPSELEAEGVPKMVDGELLLVVDQFEELYTLVDDPDQRDRFLKLLIEASQAPDSRLRVVVTLRADFYDRPLEDPRLGRLVRDGLVTVLPPSHDELVDMITAPSQAVGLRWEPGLPHHITEDVVGQPGGLPLLQYALTELVERRGADLLTSEDYTRIGGVGGAVASRAENLYRDLTPSQQEATRQVMLRLVSVDEDTDDTRRRVRRSEVESLGIPRSDLEKVLDTFISQRLLLTDRDPATHSPTVEVAHEALLRAWPRLAQWVDDQREGLILGRRFRAAVTDWENNARHDDYLLTGTRLAPYTGWAETTSLTGEENTYYRASQAKDQAERLARRRRRRTLTGVLAGAAVVATLLGSIAAVQAGRATAEAERATAEADRALAAEAEAEADRDRALDAEAKAEDEAHRARASELSAFATAALASDPSLAKLLSVASAETSEPSLDTISVLHQAWAADRVVDRYIWPEDRDVGFMWTDVSPDGTRVLAAGCSCDHPSNYLEVYDLEEGRVLWSFEVDDPRIFIDSPIFSPDGETVVAGLFWLDDVDWGEPAAGPLGLHIFDSSTGDLLHHEQHGRCGNTVFGVSATQLLIDAIPEDAEGCDWRSETTVFLVDLDAAEARLVAAQGFAGTMSGDGRYIAFTDMSATPLVFIVEEAVSGERVLEMEVDLLAGHGLALNHDGSLLTLPTRFGPELEVWDVDASELIATFDGHSARVWTVQFSPENDGTVYSTSQAGALLHWNARTGEVISEFHAVGNGNVAVSEAGLLLVADQTARVASLIDPRPRGEIWAVDTNSCSEQIQARFVHATSVGAGGRVATFEEGCQEPSGVEAKTIVLDLDEGTFGVVPGSSGDAAKVSPDGSRVARPERGDGPIVSGNEHWLGPVRTRDAVSGRLVSEMEETCLWDLTADRAGIDADQQDGCHPYPETPFPVAPREVYWSPDGRVVVVWNWIGQTVLVWNADSGELVSGYNGCTDVHTRGVHFDGTTIIVYCTDSDSPRMVLIDPGSGEEILSFEIEGFGTDPIGFVGYTPDETHMVAVRGLHGTGGGSMLWFDTETFEVEEVTRIHEGAPRSLAMSPSGRLIATGSTDGFVKVWDSVTRNQVHQIYVGEFDVRGLVFIGEANLGVVLQDGLFSVYTVDADKLVGLVRSSLTRGFTDTECERYGFHDSCPTLEELRGG